MTFNFLGPGLTVNVEAKVKEQIILDSSEEIHLVYRESASEISDSIADYLNSDRKAALCLKDDWGILDIFRAADRRIGRRQWNGLLESINPRVSNAVEKVISSRKNSC